jgi:hypothetical protein
MPTHLTGAIHVPRDSVSAYKGAVAVVDAQAPATFARSIRLRRSLVTCWHDRNGGIGAVDGVY